jgi:hypothetical protein
MSKKKVEIGSLVKFYHSDSIEAVMGTVVDLFPHNIVTVNYNENEYAIHTSAIKNEE